MRYLCLIYGDETAEARPREMEQIMKGYMAFNQAAAGAGALVGGEPLQPTATATTVRVDDSGDTLTTDGPFAETKEQLLGYYLIDCADLDEAIGWAARIPGARSGSVEVRPVDDSVQA